MNSERLILPKGRRFHIECGIEVKIPNRSSITEVRSIQRIRPFKIDPGSQITCIPASVLDVRMKEDEFIKWSDNHRTEGVPPFSVSCTGIDSKAEGIRFHYMQVESFSIKNMNLGSVPIYITFDRRYRKLLLGLDILRLLNIHQDIDANEMRLEVAEKIKNYKNTHLRITVRSMFELGIYDKEDGNAIDADLQDLIRE